MSDLPVLTALADVVSLLVEGRPTKSSSTSSSSSPPSSGPRPGVVVPGSIIVQAKALRPGPIVKVNPRLLLGPPGWLGAVTQYGQLLQSNQLNYLIEHTDAYWDAAWHQGAPRYEIDDRTSSKVLAIGHQEPPCPWVPAERKRPWAGAEITRARTDLPWVHHYTGAQAGHVWPVPAPVTWAKAAKLFGERWDGDSRWIYRFDLVDSPATLKVLREALETPEARNAVWLFWAVEGMRVRLRPGSPPVWWLRALAHWGLLASSCKQPRRWDLPCTASEPWEQIARRVIALVGMPGERDLQHPKNPCNWHPKVAALGPLRTWAPKGMDWMPLIKQAQDAEYNESALGQAAKYTNIVIGIIMTALSAYTGIPFNVLWSAAQQLRTISQGDISSVGGLIIDVVEQFGKKYVGDLEENPLISQLTKVAHGIEESGIGQAARTAGEAISELQNITTTLEDQWGWAVDLYGGGVMKTRTIDKAKMDMIP